MTKQEQENKKDIIEQCLNAVDFGELVSLLSVKKMGIVNFDRSTSKKKSVCIRINEELVEKANRFCNATDEYEKIERQSSFSSMVETLLLLFCNKMENELKNNNGIPEYFYEYWSAYTGNKSFIVRDKETLQKKQKNSRKK